jgi:hypothetical protein
MAIHQTNPFLLEYLVQLLDLNTYQSLPSHLQTLHQHTWHLQGTQNLLQGTAGFQLRHQHHRQSTWRRHQHHLTNLSPIRLQSTEDTHQLSKLPAQRPSMEQSNQPQVFPAERPAPSDPDLESAAKCPSSPIETWATSSRKSNAPST